MSGCTIKAVALLAMLAVLFVAAPIVFGRVVLRSGLVETGPIVKLSAAGVEVGGAAPRVIGWDAVAAVEGERADDARAFARLADAAWRAKSRLQRGDFRLASPLFAELFERHADAGGPTALLIAEGHLRCSLATGDMADAAHAWLHAHRLRTAGLGLAGERPGPGRALDAQTLLSPQLPPVFAADAGLAARLDELSQRPPTAESEAQASGVDADAATSTDVLAALYAVAARHAVDTSGPPGAASSSVDIAEALAAADRLATSDPGVAFVRDLVAAQAAETAEARADARAALLARLRDEPGGWREAWVRAALGRSLAHEADEDLKRLGVLQSLHVPARFLREQPYLAGAAIADAARTLRSTGDADAARRLAAELAASLPSHPAIDALATDEAGR